MRSISGLFHHSNERALHGRAAGWEPGLRVRQQPGPARDPCPNTRLPNAGSHLPPGQPPAPQGPLLSAPQRLLPGRLVGALALLPGDGQVQQHRGHQRHGGGRLQAGRSRRAQGGWAWLSSWAGEGERYAPKPPLCPRLSCSSSPAPTARLEDHVANVVEHAAAGVDGAVPVGLRVRFKVGRDREACSPRKGGRRGRRPAAARGGPTIQPQSHGCAQAACLHPPPPAAQHSPLNRPEPRVKMARSLARLTPSRLEKPTPAISANMTQNMPAGPGRAEHEGKGRCAVSAGRRPSAEQSRRTVAGCLAGRQTVHLAT